MHRDRDRDIRERGGPQSQKVEKRLRRIESSGKTGEELNPFPRWYTSSQLLLFEASKCPAPMIWVEAGKARQPAVLISSIGPGTAPLCQAVPRQAVGKQRVQRHSAMLSELNCGLHCGPTKCWCAFG